MLKMLVLILVVKVRPRFRERGVKVIVDAALEGDYDKEVFANMTNVALMCASFNKNDRPAMKVSTLRTTFRYGKS
jgi:hypothetical protein